MIYAVIVICGVALTLFGLLVRFMAAVRRQFHEKSELDAGVKMIEAARSLLIPKND